MLAQLLGFAVADQMRVMNSEVAHFSFEKALPHDCTSRRASTHVRSVMVLPPWRDGLQLIAALAGASAQTARSAAKQATD